jgi:predicted kinase
VTEALIVVSGLPGTGKTTVGEAVARRTRAVWLSVDDIEDALLGVGLPSDWTTGVAAYEAVAAAASKNLSLGHVVIVDAVNDSEPARDTWRRAADAASAPVVFVLLTPPPERQHRARLEERTRHLAHQSEPSWEHVRALARSAGVGRQQPTARCGGRRGGRDRTSGHRRSVARLAPAHRPYTDTASSLRASNGSRFQPPHRSFSRRPAMRAIRSSSLG